MQQELIILYSAIQAKIIIQIRMTKVKEIWTIQHPTTKGKVYAKICSKLYLVFYAGMSAMHAKTVLKPSGFWKAVET